jgi:hypothetical protein
LLRLAVLFDCQGAFRAGQLAFAIRDLLGSSDAFRKTDFRHLLRVLFVKVG